nr:ER degradation-enhancing alpha-mannosidase-like protein 2 [Leptinotarsa decemlineata]
MLISKWNQILFLLIILFEISAAIRTYTKDDLNKLREEVREMFYHAYDSYLKYAYPYDELRPLSCDGMDTYGSYSLTLIDALDTLAIMGNHSEFQRVVDILSTKTDFDANINVSVFETNIRIIGGLLSAHLLSHRAGAKLEPGWPCNGPLLRLAEDVAKRLIVAFDSKTGMPYGTVNLHSGVPRGETTVTCTAGVGTFIVEFGTLSRLTGDPLYEEVAMNAIYSLFNHKSQLGLFGNHIDIDSGRWTAQDAGIGSGVDSFFEYLVKGSILLQRPELMEMFHEARKSIDKYMKKDDWYMWVSMTKGQITLPVFQSLESYWPGVLSLIASGSVNGDLRKQFITECAIYMEIKDVRDHRKEDRMESFFLSETTKYLYLLFDTDNFIHNQGQYGTVINTPNGECVIEAGGYIFNTEAHPVDPSALHCCHSISNKNLLDLKELEKKKSLFRGETVRDRKNQVPHGQQNDIDTSEEFEDEKITIVTESTSTYVKLEDNDSVSQKISVANEDYQDNITFLDEADEISFPKILSQIIRKEGKKFDPQEMLERFRTENKYPRNASWENNYMLLSCKGQSFLQRLSVLGEFFNK